MMVSLEPVYRAFLETFTPEEIRVLAQNNEVLFVGYALDETGSVLEIDFTIVVATVLISITFPRNTWSS